MHMARHYESPTFEDSLGCLSLCAELEADSRPTSKGDAPSLIREHSSPTPLYFCLSPNCNTPSASAADHPPACSRLSISGTLCEEHDFDTMPVADYPLEKFPAFDANIAPHSDLERQICDRSYPLPQPASRRGWSERYQYTLWFLSNRPRDSALVLFGLIILFFAALALGALLGLVILAMRGELTGFNNFVDSSFSWMHTTVLEFLRGFEKLQPAHGEARFLG